MYYGEFLAIVFWEFARQARLVNVKRCVGVLVRAQV